MGLAIFGANSTTQAIWVSSPGGRGTFDILSTCIITLGLCVYSAIHLNIPSPAWGSWTKAGMKAKWLLIALFAPELVVYNAWRQRREAQQITRLLREYYGQPHPPSQLRRVVRWLSPKKVSEKVEDAVEQPISLIHGFYVVMGGFCLDMTHDSERVWPRGLSRLVLEPRGVALLLEDFSSISAPYISAKDISDKSKADHLAKSLVCLQALWYCTNFFSRLAMGLPITLLELNTFAHSICALLIYILWWEKPLDIGEPTWIKTDTSEAHRDFCAVCFSLDSCLWNNTWKVTEKGTGKLIKWSRIRHSGNNELSIISQSSNQMPKRLQSPWLAQMLGSQSKERPTQKFTGRRPSIPSFRGLDTNERHYLFTSYDPPIIQLKACDSIPDTNLYVNSTFETIEIDETVLARVQRYSRFVCSRTIKQRDRLLSKREPNYSISSVVPAKSNAFGFGFGFDEIQVAAITLSGLFYGGLHALSWNSAALRTGSETLLWKISCVTILSAGFLLVVMLVLHGGWDKLEVSYPATGIKKIWSDFYNPANDILFFLVLLPLLAVLLAVLLLHILARVYLVVEVFISLPHADPAVYQTPDWSAYWPHFS